MDGEKLVAKSLESGKCTTVKPRSADKSNANPRVV